MRRHFFLLGVLTASVTLSAADPPYAGKWKMNPAKSDLGQMTVTYEQLPSGDMQATIDGQSYKFRMDGKDYPAVYGTTAAWKSINATTWQTIAKVSGKTVTTDTLALSGDSKSLTVSSKRNNPTGGTVDDTMVFQRVSGASGLAGKWQAKNFKSSSPAVLELAASGTNGLAYKVPEQGLTCDSKLDGKDYPCSGPTIAAGWTVALAKSGDRIVDMTAKMNGKVLYKVTYTVSADGKTLTESGGATATSEKITVVYDRQ